LAQSVSLTFPLNNHLKMKPKILLLTGAAVATFTLPLSLSAQTTPHKASSPSPSASPAASAAEMESPAKHAGRPVPFHGMVSAVDQDAKTFTISGKETSRVFKVTDKTAITKSGKPATITDITENEEVSGSYWKHPDGTLEAKKVKIGPRKKKEEMTSPAASPMATASPKASPKTTSTPKPY
jgi:hypothetical protein